MRQVDASRFYAPKSPENLVIHTFNYVYAIGELSVTFSLAAI